MASGERTEAATPHRLQEMRAKGQVARSAEVNAAIGLFASFAVLQQFGPEMTGRLQHLLQQSLLNLGQAELTLAVTSQLGQGLGVIFFGVMAPLFILLPIAGVVGNIAQVGPLISTKALAPDPERINPLAGFKRLFSTRSLVELAKALIKTGLVMYILSHLYTESLAQLLDLASAGDLRAAVPRLGELGIRLGMMTTAAFLVVAVLDYGYQRWDFSRSARMTKDDLRQESKQMEGSPEVRQQIRQRQRRLSQGRMLQEVPLATVVVTNPTHFAVALAYSADEGGAPRVVAKGADLIAARIREIATAHGVPIVENRPLAQALYRYVDIGREIPASLFAAVAEVLAYIYRLRPDNAPRAGVDPQTSPAAPTEGTRG